MYTETIIELLGRLEAGDPKAASELFGELYGELRSRAHRLLSDGTPHTLQATALVHEAWIRLQSDGVGTPSGRAHFLALAARAMRSVLVDHARARSAIKRGGGVRPAPLDEALAVFSKRVPDLLDLNEKLEELSELDERLARVVELRFFGGLSIDETAGVLGVGSATVERDWTAARAYLAARLDGESEGAKEMR